MPIYSIEVEKHALRGLIKYPNIFADIEPFLNEFDFYNDVHSTIFCVLREAARKNEKLDKVLLGQKIKNLGVKFKDEIDIFEYIDILYFSQITAKATLDSCRELVKIRIRRDLYNTGEEIKGLAKAAGSKDIDAIIGEADAIYAKKISSYESNDEPVNLFENAEQIVEERGNNPLVDTGLVTPYPEFNRLYGGLKEGNIYAIVSRPSHGKSSFLNDICFKISLNSGFKVKALFLDTEMSTEDVRWRMVASLTGVGMWFLETGNWRKNPEMIAKVRPALKVISQYQYHHYPVGNKTTEQVCSIVRRWRYKNLFVRGKKVEDSKAIVCYDYIKLTGEKISQNYAEHQAIGQKVDNFKKLSEEVKCPFMSAMQLNRAGESFNKKSADVTDDSSAISLSDRLQWYGSWISIFRRKTLDEIAEDGQEFGTHKMINLKSRFQGKDAAGHHDLVKKVCSDGEERYVNNYLNFGIDNFNVTEKGSLKDIVNKQKRQYQADDSKSDDGDII